MSALDANDVPLDDWKSSWQGGRTAWHLAEEHKLIMKHFDRLRGARANLKILFPLCGKAFDMKFLSDGSHRVVGVEISELAAQQFFTENNMEFTTSQLQSVDGKLYQNQEGTVKIYVCSMFDFHSKLEGQFDVVWDRGSLVAINVSDRPKYVDIMMECLKPDGFHLLEAVEYDDTKYPGPPRVVREDEIKQIFGGTNMRVERLEEAPMQGRDPPECQRLGLRVSSVIYQLTRTT